MHYSCGRETRSINENSNKKKTHYDSALRQWLSCALFTQGKDTGKWPFWNWLWVESEMPAWAV